MQTILTLDNLDKMSTFNFTEIEFVTDWKKDLTLSNAFRGRKKVENKYQIITDHLFNKKYGELFPEHKIPWDKPEAGDEKMTILDNIHREQQDQGNTKYSTIQKVKRGSAHSRVAFFEEL